MELEFAALNWVGILVGVIAGQAVSTIWFVALFGEAWAREYGAESKKQHTKEVPPYTYGIGLLCTVALVVSIAVLQHAFAVKTIGAALQLATLLSVGFCIATGVPGLAFLRRWRVAAIAYGSQIAMIVVISSVLVLFG